MLRGVCILVAALAVGLGSASPAAACHPVTPDGQPPPDHGCGPPDGKGGGGGDVAPPPVVSDLSVLAGRECGPRGRPCARLSLRLSKRSILRITVAGRNGPPTLFRRRADEGTGSVTLSRRMRRGRSYRVEVVAVDSGGTESKPAVARFRIPARR